MSEPQQLVEKSRIAFLDIITDSNFSAMRDGETGPRPAHLPEHAQGRLHHRRRGRLGRAGGAQPEGWRYPAFYTIASGSLGLQIGGQSAELVITVMSAKAMDAVIDNQFKIGGNVDVAVGPVGRG